MSLVLNALHMGALPLLLLALGLAGFVRVCQPDAGMPLQDAVICVSDWQPYTSLATLILYKPCVALYWATLWLVDSACSQC
jgi:hypothetical protein